MRTRPGWVWRALSVLLPVIGEMYAVTLVARQCGTEGWGTVAAVVLWWSLRAEAWEEWVIEEL